MTVARPVVAAAVLLTFVACGGEEPLGVPDEPVDGAWFFDGVFSNLETDVRCRLTADATLVSGAGMSLTGSGTVVLDCDVRGTSERFEATSEVMAGRINGDAISLSIGLCAFNGRYLGAELEGAAGCVFELSPSEDVGTVGHWRAFRSEGALTGGTS